MQFHDHNKRYGWLNFTSNYEWLWANGVHLKLLNMLHKDHHPIIIHKLVVFVPRVHVYGAWVNEFLANFFSFIDGVVVVVIAQWVSIHGSVATNEVT